MVLYRVFFHYFDRFLSENEGSFEMQYGFFRPIPSKGWAEIIRKGTCSEFSGIWYVSPLIG